MIVSCNFFLKFLKLKNSDNKKFQAVIKNSLLGVTLIMKKGNYAGMKLAINEYMENIPIYEIVQEKVPEQVPSK